MEMQQFCYWLQGFAELSGDTPPTAAQWKSIREHLAQVFDKRTPPVEEPLCGEGPVPTETPPRGKTALEEAAERIRQGKPLWDPPYPTPTPSQPWRTTMPFDPFLDNTYVKPTIIC